MGKPLMLQEADDARIDSLEKRLHARMIKMLKTALEKGEHVIGER